MPSLPSSAPFAADARRQANRGTIWSATKWGTFDALFLIWGWWPVSSPNADPGSQLVGAAFVIAAVVGMFYIVRNTKRRLTSGSHPLDKELSAFGELSAIAHEFNAAFVSRQFLPRRVQIANGWLCYVGRQHTIVRRLDRQVWAYKLRVWHFWNGIPYRVSNNLMILDRNGRITAIPGSNAILDRALKELRATAPWLLFGHSETLEETWNSDRAELIAYVDSLRQRAMRQASGSGEREC